MMTTLLGCLFLGLDLGIIIGILVNLLFVLYSTARPKIVQEEKLVDDFEVIVVRPEQTLYYPAAEYVKDLVMKVSLNKSKNLVIIDGKNIQSIDVTVAKNIKTLIQDLEKLDIKIVLWNWEDLPFETCLKLDPKLNKYFQKAKTIQEMLQNERDLKAIV